MRYFIRLSYNGKLFHGWQSQPNAKSVQQTLEEALQTVLRNPTPIVGAGRTDAGVNARVMYAHFDTAAEISGNKRLIVGLNRLCGKGIAVENIFRVPDTAHARFDAVKRTYKYFVTFAKSPFLRDFSWHSPSALDVEGMNEAAQTLLHTDDFTSFAKLHSDAKTNICRVTEARWKKWENNYATPGIVFTISADRFLRNMVRSVVGTLVDVGRGKLTSADFKEIIEKRNRCAAGTSMPAEALFLWDIEYPENYVP
ncbi:MAG: tRNA pseudouridine(38-40) synthase TruA [Candidatus Amulumruptor caecigallinarius]|nr:tRNA pseudouridine(38-40) synthase TruA [Candidatus Amulumruptor caecigallinarius]